MGLWRWPPWPHGGSGGGSLNQQQRPPRQRRQHALAAVVAATAVCGWLAAMACSAQRDVEAAVVTGRLVVGVPPAGSRARVTYSLAVQLPPDLLSANVLADITIREADPLHSSNVVGVVCQTAGGVINLPVATPAACEGGGHTTTCFAVGSSSEAVAAVSAAVAGSNCALEADGVMIAAVVLVAPQSQPPPPPPPSQSSPLAWVLEGLLAAGVLETDYEAQWERTFGGALTTAGADSSAAAVEGAIAGLRQAGAAAGAALAGLPRADPVLLTAAGRRSLIANATRAYARVVADAESPAARLSAWLAAQPAAPVAAYPASGLAAQQTVPVTAYPAGGLAAEVGAVLDPVLARYLPAPALLEVGAARVSPGHAAAGRLLTMLVEVHSKTAALVAAGVTSKEIFACVVDMLMDAAPEIILQIIVSAVRDPIVNVVGMIMGLIVPPILVPPTPPDTSDARFAAVEAQAAAWSWLHDSAYGAPAGGPIAHMMPKLKEGICGGLTAVAMPRVAAGTTRAVLDALDATLPATLHRGVSRATIFALTQRLTDGIFMRVATTLTQRLSTGTAHTLVARLVAPLSRTLSHSLTHALTRHPATDYFCAYCAAASHGNATSPADGAVEALGPYCIACRRARAHDALMDANLDARWRAAANVEVAAALRHLPAPKLPHQ